MTEGEIIKPGFLSQSACSADSPSSEGAVGGYHPYTHVLVNDPTTGYGIFIENRLDAAA